MATVDSEKAPTLAELGITEVETTTPQEVEYSEPELTAEKAEEAISYFSDIEAANGYLGIARTVGLSASQVAKLHEEYLSLLTPDE